MKTAHVFTLFAFGLSAVCSAGHIPTGPFLRPPPASDILEALGPLLSPGADIFFPESPEWANLTTRWDPYSNPIPSATVEAATSADVQHAVRYATKRGLRILVRNTSHGFTKTLEAMDGGIQISLARMNGLSLDAERHRLTVGGGVENWQIVDELYAVNQRTSTGGCDCVGIMGLVMGGGHGKLQGLYGVVSDVLLEAEVVLADGRIVNASAKENTDLFWALRGAGHSFGIVTKAVIQTFDNRDPATADVWINADFSYRREQLEDVFTFLESYRATQPVELTIFAGLRRTTNPDGTDGAPIINLSLQYFGPLSFDELAAPFLAQNPFSTVNDTHTWPEIAPATGIGRFSPACSPSSTRRAHFSNLLPRLEVESVVQMYDWFAELPQAFRWTSVVWELYPLQKFREIASESTAYPHRDLDIISLAMINYEGEENDAEAAILGEEARRRLVIGSDQEGLGDRMRVYTNYAEGYEGPVVWYGGKASERKWRLGKLKGLKKKYDPGNVWSGYNPVIPPGRR